MMKRRPIRLGGVFSFGAFFVWKEARPTTTKRKATAVERRRSADEAQAKRRRLTNGDGRAASGLRRILYWFTAETTRRGTDGKARAALKAAPGFYMPKQTRPRALRLPLAACPVACGRAAPPNVSPDAQRFPHARVSWTTTRRRAAYGGRAREPTSAPVAPTSCGKNRVARTTGNCRQKIGKSRNGTPEAALLPL